MTENGFISTHLDTLDPELYNVLHGGEICDDNQDNIRLILKGIKNTLAEGKESGAMVNCITYTSPLAEGDTKGMISYFQEKFGIKTCLTLFNPVIHQSGNRDWEPSISQIKDAFIYKDKINYPDDPSCGPMDVSKFYCGTVVCITADGWLVLCSIVRTKEFGNIHDERLDILVEKNKKRLLFMDFRELSNLPGNCSSCSNNSFCFGCRSSAYYYSGDILAADPKCYQYSQNKAREED